MKKLSKSKRRKLKEAEERKVIQRLKAGVPYSRHPLNNRKKICYHYIPSVVINGILTKGKSLLHQINENEYVCTVCNHIFDAEDNKKIELLAEVPGLPSNYGGILKGLPSPVKPVSFYYNEDGKIVEVINE